MWREFKEFISKGNVMELAVGVIIGAAFGKIVSSVVDDLISPVIGKITGGIDLSRMALPLGTTTDDGGKIVEVALKYGSFVQSLINFLIVAFVIFMLVKGYNRLRRTAASDEAASPTPTESLLTEIRDLLKIKA